MFLGLWAVFFLGGEGGGWLLGFLSFLGGWFRISGFGVEGFGCLGFSGFVCLGLLGFRGLSVSGF